MRVERGYVCVGTSFVVDDVSGVIGRNYMSIWRPIACWVVFQNALSNQQVYPSVDRVSVCNA
jgi:hypothetical protein